MSDFESLKADRNFAGSLLRSAAGDAPSAHARRLAASSLGVGIGMLATTSVVPSALAAGQALGTSATQVVVPAGVKAISALVVSKWLVSSFVVGVVASSSVITVHELVTSREAPGLTERAEPNPPRASERARASKQARASERVTRDPQPAPLVEPSALEGEAHVSPSQASPSTLPHSRARSGAAANVTRASTSGPERQVAQQPGTTSQHPVQASVSTSPEADVASLDEEIAWLEPARRSLQAKDGRQALAALDLATPHVRLLASEAALLRVEALVLVGRRAEARRIAEPFLSRHPSSPHAERLRRLLDQP